MNPIQLAKMVLSGVGGPYQQIAIYLAKFILENEKYDRHTPERDPSSLSKWDYLPPNNDGR